MISRVILQGLDDVDPDRRRLWAVRLLLATTALHVASHAALAALQTMTRPAAAQLFFEHMMLFISFVAIEVTCVDVVATNDVRANEG